VVLVKMSEGHHVVVITLAQVLPQLDRQVTALVVLVVCGSAVCVVEQDLLTTS
jgi:hypothetical protein